MLPKTHLILMFLLPFSNDIANALTISDVGDFKRLYKPCNHDIDSKLKASLIDLIALFGIIWNVSYMASKYGTRAGCIYGFIILILSFIIPNEFMEISVNYICNMKNTKENECSVILKFIACILFISILLIAEILTSRYLKNKRWKYSARYSKS